MKRIIGLFSLLLILNSCNTEVKKETDKKSEFNFEAAGKLFNDNRIQTDKAKEEKKLKQKLREDIGLKKFDTQDVEISEAELWYEGQNIVRIDVRFYSGAPIGTKHWYIKDGKPVGVAVAQFAQAEDASLEEKSLYELLYDESEKRWMPVNMQGGEKDLDEIKKEKYNKENNAEWELLKGLSEKFKPKAE
jgi:hypothetical protein